MTDSNITSLPERADAPVLGITRMRVLSAPKRMLGLSGFGLEVVEYVDG